MSTEKIQNELKLQGVVEASQDPESKVTADDAQKKILEESKKAGVTAFTFDPDASPEEKRAQARAAIPEGFHNDKAVKGVSVVTDVDDGSAPTEDLPPPSKDGVLDVAKDKDGKPMADGQDPEAEDPYLKTGWAPRLGWPQENPMEGESLLDHTTWLESKIPDHLFGDWYHNAAIIVFACLASWLVAVFGGGIGWVVLVMTACATYYRTSIRRVRRNFRDDINRELSMKRLETDAESLEWINSFMFKFWPIYQPVLAATVINTVDQVLSTSTPAFLDSLKLKTFTLGSKPPRMEYVRTLPAEDDYVIMDWKFSFTPNDTADMTAKQITNKINPKVVLEIRIGKAMLSKGLDVIVEDMAFSGLMRLKIKLQIPFPHVDRVEMCFMEKPTIDYVCKPLGGDTFGFDINFIPGLESFILDMIHATLEPMMYAPNVFPIEVAKMLAGTPVDQAIGVVAVTLHGAHGLRNTDNFAGNVDPYAVITLNKRQELARTKTVRDNANPRWNETHYIIITSFNESLDIQVFDYNDFRKSKELGVASFLLEHLENLNAYENERLEVSSGGKARGVLSCDIRFFPVLEDTKLPDGKVEPPPETNQGILRFTVEQAKDLDGSKSLVGLLNPYAVLYLNGHSIHQTKKLKRTNNPIWDNGFKEILITDKKKARLAVTVKDDRDITGDQTLGSKQIKLDDLLENMEESKEWYLLDGPNSGRVKMTAKWKPVAISGVMGGTGGYITPIGVMRIHLQKASDLRNFESLGKSDPYVRVLLSGIEKARTVTFKNNLNPDWDEVLYIPVHSAREKLSLEVMDEEKMGKDRSLGSTEILAGDYIKQQENGEYLVHDEKALREDGLQLHGKGVAKGLLTYTAAFYPCLNIADPEDEEEGEEGKDTSDPAPPADATALSPASPSIEKQPTSKSLEPRTPTTPATPMSTRKSSEEQKGPPAVRLSPQELLKYESGLVLVRLMEAELPKSNTHVEVFVDDMAFPSFVSSTSKTRTHKFEEIGDCFIRELEWSHLTLKIREKGDSGQEGDKDHTLAFVSGDTLATLKQCLNNPTTLSLKVKDEEGKTSKVKVSMKYLPVKMQLDPSESINNMGTLRVEALDAQDLPAADKNGKSDPFCKFELNGVQVFKTQVQRKTLHPVWNEFFEVAVPSRTSANFRLEVYDWDLTSNADFLGAAAIKLVDLEPFQRKEVKLNLDGDSGSVRLRLLFTPTYIKRTRQGTSTFSGTFAAPTRIVTGVAGAPLKLGQGVGKVGSTFLKRGFKGKKDDANGSSDVGSANGSSPVPSIGVRRATGITEEPEPETSQTPSNGASSHARTKSFGAASIHSTIAGGATGGTATFTVVSASGYPSSADVFVVLTQMQPRHRQVHKTKDHKASSGPVKFDETFKFQCTPDATFQIAVKGHHTFSSDDDLGEALYFVDESGSGEKEVAVGEGKVTMKSTFVPAADSTPDSPKSSLRRSFLSKRDSRAVSREATPNP